MAEFKEHDEKNVEITGARCLRDSKMAVLIRITWKDKVQEFWVPQSQVHAHSEVWVPGDEGKLVISKWIAIERGFWEKEDDDG